MARSPLVLSLTLLALALVSSSTATQGKTAGIYELKKGNFSVKVTNFGAAIISVVLPDSKGNLADIALGYDEISSYANNTKKFGAVVGRVANRISGAQFVLNGQTYKLNRNNGNNTIHGGFKGFHQVMWTVKSKVDGEFPYITLYYNSPDKEGGFPGDLDAYVTYKISGAYELEVAMRATPRNKATPVNLAQHSYWNLGGHDSGTILSNHVQIFASHITPVNDALIPTGAIASVSGTPYDFLRPMKVESRIEEVRNGYDINYVLGSPADGDGMRKAAIVKDGGSGRELELWTNQPGMQFYTGNNLNNIRGKGGHIYGPHSGLCLETQGFPDAVNHPNFPSQIVNAGETYKHFMLYKFSF